MPPSGPMIISTDPAAGRSIPTRESAAPSCSTRARSTEPILATSSRVDTGSATPGTRSRRHCLAASRATERHRASDRSARSAVHRTTDRDAAHGTISSMPSSVSISTASSARSPLARACAAMNRSGRDEDRVRVCETSMTSPALAASTTRPRTPRPRPSPTRIISPGRIRRTTAACRPSSPSRRTRSPMAGSGSSASDSRKKSGSVTDRRRRPAAGRRRRGRSSARSPRAGSPRGARPAGAAAPAARGRSGSASAPAA